MSTNNQSPLQQLIASMQPPAQPQTAAPAPPPASIFVYSDDMLDATQTVTTLSNDGHPIVVGIELWDFATEKGAEAMQAWLKTQGVTTTIVKDWPLYPQTAGDRDVQSNQCPWLIDGKGAKENPADLIWNFTRMPYSMAARIAIQSFALDDAPQQ